MNWFIYAFKNSFNFRGRARRAEYGWFNLINWLIEFALQLIIFAVAMAMNATHFDEFDVDLVTLVLYGVLILYYLATVIPKISVTIRRMHDLGWSAWWLLWLTLIVLVLAGVSLVDGLELIAIILIFVITIGFALILYFKDGQRMENKYGADPKAEQSTQTLPI